MLDHVRGQQRAKGRDLVDQAAQVRSMGQDVIDLGQKMTCGRLLGQGDVHLAELQTDADCDVRQHDGADGSGSHGPGELAVGCGPVPRCTASRAAAAKASALMA